MMLTAMALASVSGSTTGVAQPSGISLLVSRVGERVSDFYRQAQTVMCTERSTVQPVSRDWSGDGMQRTV